MHSWALALGSPAGVFDGAFGDRPSTLIKLVRYPGREDRGQGVGAHKDPGVLTLLMVEPGSGGLQVDTPEGLVDATDGYLNPALDSVMPHVDLPPELARHAPGVTQDPDNVISGTFGDNMLKARMRAHPMSRESIIRTC